jgi:microcystin-dependent protein
MPLGYPFIWMLDTLPTDCLDLIGQVISRTTYADLFALWGTTYGVGDGSTTFALPDMRGLFMRLQDQGAGVDPDAASRTNRGDGQTGDKVGTKQGGAVGQHSHTMKGNSQGAGVDLAHPLTAGSTLTGLATTEPMTGTIETRPVNIYVRMIVRAL